MSSGPGEPMYPAPGQTSLRRAGSRLTVAGDLDQAARRDFWSALEELLADAADEVQVELGAVTFMDAAGLTALLRAQREASELGVRLVLVSPSLAVLRVLDRTQASPLFDIRV